MVEPSRKRKLRLAQFVQQDQVLPGQLFLQTLQGSFLSRFQQLGHQARRGVKRTRLPWLHAAKPSAVAR